MRFRELVLGRSTVEYRSYLRKERRLNEAGQKDLKESRWVAAEEDWPVHHSADVPDRKAAELIWSRTFAVVAERIQDSFKERPVSDSAQDGKNPV
ncbi:hypothetical protein [Umezawaea sp.]|uniref:hypothetical protein n=1 Tax=Umezawaea sp. TaxID=1955258 RepID=UPI002ED18C8C